MITTQGGLIGDFDQIEVGSTTGAVGTKEGNFDYRVGCDVCAANHKVVKDSADAAVMGVCTLCSGTKTNTKGDAPWGAATVCDIPVVDCEVNQHVTDNTCTPCALGTTRDVIDKSSGADTECAITYCKKDHHVVSNTCQPCASGSTRDAGDSGRFAFVFV